MNNVLRRLVSFGSKNGLHFKKNIIHRKAWYISSRCRHEDRFFTVEDEKALNNEEYDQISNEYFGPAIKGHRTFVIQPYIKFSQNKKTNTNRDLQLAEAVALVESLPYWTVVDKMHISLMNLDKVQLMGSGKLEEVKTRIKCGRNITAIFISTTALKHVQLLELEKIFGMPIYDRYSLIIHIFRSHAKSAEARLQVALAEIPYIYKKMSEIGGRINLLEKRRLYLHARESQLKTALKKIRQNREAVRQKRKNYGFVSIAIVGYTNAGKTSLIKALTGDEKLEPKNYLFATLDTTAHEGLLPCKMKVLYIDTIGFIQDVPERLIEPFVATLEDALVADIIVHVYDASHPDKTAQVDYVRKTIKSLTEGKPLIEVANKCDLVAPEDIPEDVLCVSAKTLTGTDLLRNKIQKHVLSETGRSIIRMRVESGSEASTWLYKETTVIEANADPADPQFMLLDVIVTDNTLHRFRRFLRQDR